MIRNALAVAVRVLMPFSYVALVLSLAVFGSPG